jgi:hypothetical protein
MADTKVSALTSASALDGTEKIPVVQSSTSKAATPDQIITRGGGMERDNAATSTPAAGFAADTYLAGSGVTIPDGKVQAKSKYYCMFRVSKTAAGTATPIITVRVGTAGTTADTARLTFTFAAGTAAVDTGIFELWISFQSVGSGTSAVLEGTIELRKSTATAAGITNDAKQCINQEATSAGFDSTVSGLTIGVSVNGGTSAAWTISNVRARVDNLI